MKRSVILLTLALTACDARSRTAEIDLGDCVSRPNETAVKSDSVLSLSTEGAEWSGGVRTVNSDPDDQLRIYEVIGPSTVLLTIDGTKDGVDASTRRTLHVGDGEVIHLTDDGSVVRCARQR